MTRWVIKFNDNNSIEMQLSFQSIGNILCTRASNETEYQTQFAEDREWRTIPASPESRIQWTPERGSRPEGFIKLINGLYKGGRTYLRRWSWKVWLTRRGARVDDNGTCVCVCRALPFIRFVQQKSRFPLLIPIIITSLCIVFCPSSLFRPSRCRPSNNKFHSINVQIESCIY